MEEKKKRKTTNSSKRVSETPWLFPIFPKDNLDLFIFWWGSAQHTDELRDNTHTHRQNSRQKIPAEFYFPKKNENATQRPTSVGSYHSRPGWLFSRLLKAKRRLSEMMKEMGSRELERARNAPDSRPKNLDRGPNEATMEMNGFFLLVFFSLAPSFHVCCSVWNFWLSRLRDLRCSAKRPLIASL